VFVDAPAVELNQGDVCAVEAFPQWDLRSTPSVNVGGEVKYLQMPVWRKPVQEPGNGRTLICVVSYDCDIENPRSRTGLLVAP
jgi:hypothetical protein